MTRETRIALLRGINIIGSNSLPMNALKALLEQHGCREVRTYIQSGNAIFETAADAGRLAERIASGVAKRHGFQPHVLVLTRRELEQAANNNPFKQADENPRSVHVFFLSRVPSKPDFESLNRIRTTEAFLLKGRCFYLYTPDGFGKSKVASRAEKLLGVEATARNWRTVTTLVEMAKRNGPCT